VAAQLLCTVQRGGYAASQKVAGSSLDEVIEDLFFLAALWSWDRLSL
jgi:hypothetical protein